MEIAIFAMHICSIFKDDKLANDISKHANYLVLSRHDGNNNAINLNSIYKQIIDESISAL